MADNTTLPGTGDVIASDDIGGVKYQIVKAAFGALDTATLVSSTNPLPTDTRQVGGTAVNASPVGFQRVTDEPHTIFYDPFESLDTTNRWTSTSAGGGVAAAVSVGRLTLGSGTTANGYAYLTSQPTFMPTVPGWLGFSFIEKIESAVGINAVRFWGMGLVSGSVPSSTNPLGTTGNGMGFEVDTAGVLRAVMYSAGTRTVINALASNQPADANDHRYIVAYRTDRTDFYIDGLSAAQLVATASFQSPQVQVLSMLLLSVAHSTGPAASRTIDCEGLAVWDTAKGNVTISDGALPYRKVTIAKPSTAAAATDSPMVVALHPSSIGPVNNSQINGVTPLMGNGVTGTGAQRVTIASDNTAFAVNATLQTGAAVIGALSANQSANVAQINGVTALMGNGITGTGSQRVTVASDNTPFPVKIDQTTPGTTNLVALAANQSVNKAQINGVAPLMGNGITGTGSQRVTIASDNTAFAVNATLQTGAAVIGALSANQSVNVAQINAVAPLMGNGVTGTGSQRVTLASDNSALPAAGQGAIAAAAPAGATMPGLKAATANPTNATAGNLVAPMGDKAGRAVVTPVQVRELTVIGTLSVAATSETTLIAAGGAGVFNDIIGIIITTAGAAAQTITVKDGTAGTTRAVFNYPNAALAPASPFQAVFPVPLPQSAANANWTVTQSVATACNYTFLYAKNL